MPTISDRLTARTAPTQFVDVEGRRLAYRMIGEGPPLVLCLRFRGILDSWDPAFLDTLAEKFTLVTFDYSGIGQSTGTPSYRREDLARDAKALVDALGLGRVVIAGWSIGGIAAQIFGALYPESASHVIAIGTMPPGMILAAAPRRSFTASWTMVIPLTSSFRGSIRLSQDYSTRSEAPLPASPMRRLA